MSNNTPLANYSVGQFLVQPSRNMIVDAHGNDIAITPKMLAILTELANNQGETLSKEHLLNAVWGTVHTSDMVLSRGISDLRKVFGDSAKKQLFIETISKQGYSLKQPVTWQEATAPEITEEIQHTESEIGEETKSSPLSSYAIFVGIILFAAVMGWFMMAKDDLETQEKAFQSRQITNNNDTEAYVRFSPDGKYLAYANNKKEESGRYIQLTSLADNSHRKLIDPTLDLTNKDTKFYDASPAFSPDHQMVAYRHHTPNGCSIKLVELATDVHKKLVDCPNSTINALDWSPDGKFLVTTLFNHINKTESLTLVELATGKTTTLKSPEKNASGYLWPRFSPSGKSIAVVYYQPNDYLWSIGEISVDTGEYKEILPLGEEISQVVWNTSGDALFYLVVESAKAGIWQVDLSSQKSRLIKLMNSRSLDFDEQYGQLVHIAKERKISIYKAEKLSNEDVNISPVLQDFPQSFSPTLSRDETSLAFITHDGGVDSLWVRRLERNVNYFIMQAKPNEKLLDPRWSSDNKTISVSVMSSENHQVMEFDLILGNAKSFDENKNVKFLQWSVDGKTKYWYEKREGIWQVFALDLATKKETVLLDHPVARFEVQGDIIYFQKIGSSHIHKRSLSAGEHVDEMMLALRGSYDWDINDKVIYYLSRSSDKTKQLLYRMGLSSKQPEPLFAINEFVLGSGYGRHLTVNKEGNTAYFTRQDSYQTNIVLMHKE